MSVTEQGDGWTVEVTDGVMIWEFLKGMDLESFREDAFPVFERIVTTRDVTGMVAVVDLDDLFNDSVFQVWEDTARRAAQNGVDRWAVVADGIRNSRSVARSIPGALIPSQPRTAPKPSSGYGNIRTSDTTLNLH